VGVYLSAQCIPLFTHYHLLDVTSAYKQTKEYAGLKLHGSNRGTLLTEHTTGYVFLTHPFMNCQMMIMVRILIGFITGSAAVCF